MDADRVCLYLKKAQDGDSDATKKLIEEICDETTCDFVVGAISKSGNPFAVDLLIQALDDIAIFDVSYATIAHTLGELGDERAIRPLIKVLHNRSLSDGRVAIAEALNDLNAIGQAFAEIERHSIKKDNFCTDCWGAAQALAEKSGIGLFFQILSNSRSSLVREALANVLEERNDIQAVDPLIQALCNENEHVRKAAAISLGKLGDTRAVEPLVRALADKNAFVIVAAAGSLGKLGDTRAVEPLFRALADKNVDVIVAAAGSLRKLGYQRSVVKPLLAILRNRGRGIGQEEARKAAHELYAIAYDNPAHIGFQWRKINRLMVKSTGPHSDNGESSNDCSHSDFPPIELPDNWRRWISF